jgi:LacI family transcriptional regulator
MVQALEHLVGQGRRTIAMLDFSVTGKLSPRGLEFNDILGDLEAKGGAVLAAALSEPDMDAGGAAVGRLFDAWPDLDAVVAFNDSVAIGIIKELQKRGLTVPEQVAVLGIDGLPIGRIVTPELSSLQLDMRDVGDSAVKLVVGMWSGDLPLRGPEVHQHVHHTLLVRESA